MERLSSLEVVVVVRVVRVTKVPSGLVVSHERGSESQGLGRCEGRNWGEYEVR